MATDVPEHREQTAVFVKAVAQTWDVDIVFNLNRKGTLNTHTLCHGACSPSGRKASSPDDYCITGQVIVADGGPTA